MKLLFPIGVGIVTFAGVLAAQQMTPAADSGTITVVPSGAAAASSGPASPTFSSASLTPTNQVYYVDCGAATNGNGSQNAPWNNVGSVNGKSGGFGPGDWIMLRRGTICNGMLAPQGSGSAGAPITITAYDTTRSARPIVNGGTNQAALKLFNQEYWSIEKIETSGGTPFGIYISGNQSGRVLRDIRVTNVVIHDVGGTVTNKQTGLLVIAPEVTGTIFDGVVVDGVTAFATTQWAGMRIAGQPPGAGTGTSAHSRNITVRNSTVHDTGGEGILLSQVDNGLIENNVAYNTGQTSVTNLGSPNGIWTWGCNDCVVQFNEVYNTDSPVSLDGGAFDIDYFTNRNTYQYNYGHDTQGYCVTALGASNYTTTDAVIRYNVCSYNGRGSDLAGQGAIYTYTWDGGLIDGLKIYNNTIYWDPVIAKSAIINKATYTGSQDKIFANNIIYSTVPNMVYNVGSSLLYNNNIYWTTAGATPIWWFNNTSYAGFAAWRAGSGQDAAGKFLNPFLVTPLSHAAGRPTTAFTLQAGSPAINAGVNVGSMGTRDFYGNVIPQGGAYDVGAHERQ
ncbi:right-handed parallel beta-helix repeat-containing protein [Sphingomonas sp. CCH15-F11]|uniref:right-handed parallel beta-helix repeat-containing protein n=1 Tax=Sphingomonas sp. CCH15-F11 TaxID=1768785 RepID=UPI0018D22844|nr:right-handed parallel beta-helix repeat-containing protein [Sphingomonas sp. CCH15-F11]